MVKESVPKTSILLLTSGPGGWALELVLLREASSLLDDSEGRVFLEPADRKTASWLLSFEIIVEVTVSFTAQFLWCVGVFGSIPKSSALHKT